MLVGGRHASPLRNECRLLVIFQIREMFPRLRIRWIYFQCPLKRRNRLLSSAQFLVRDAQIKMNERKIRLLFCGCLEEWDGFRRITLQEERTEINIRFEIIGIRSDLKANI